MLPNLCMAGLCTNGTQRVQLNLAVCSIIQDLQGHQSLGRMPDEDLTLHTNQLMTHAESRCTHRR